MEENAFDNAKKIRPLYKGRIRDMKILTLDLEYDFETDKLDNLKLIPKDR